MQQEQQPKSMITLGTTKAIFYNKEEQKKEDYVDPNIVRIELHQLEHQIEEQTQLPQQCSHCQAYRSTEAIVENKWKCQWCQHEHECQSSNYQSISVEENMINEKDYIIERKEEMKVEGIANVSNESTIVFCIDISGSMDGQRIACIKQAISTQIEQMVTENPKVKICIVLFSSNVEILGDCCHTTINVKEQFNNSFDSLVDIANEKVELFPLEQSKDNLMKQIKDIRADGCTALGPAVLISTVIAGKESNGQVILCTDGEANEGLRGSEFYNRVADLAISKGVIININTIDGCNANVSEIREMSMKTNGTVITLDVSSIGMAFTDTLSNRLVARNVSFRIQLDPRIEFKELDTLILRENKQNIDQHNCIVVRKGNVIDDSDFYFSYKLKDPSMIIPSFRFQIVIEYTVLRGDKWRRIITKEIPVCQPDEEMKSIEKNAELIQAFYIRRIGETKRQRNDEQSRKYIQTFRTAQATYVHANQAMYKDVIDEYEYGFDQEAHNDYYSSQTQNAAMFTMKSAGQRLKYSKKEYLQQKTTPGHSSHHHLVPPSVHHHQMQTGRIKPVHHNQMNTIQPVHVVPTPIQPIQPVGNVPLPIQPIQQQIGQQSWDIMGKDSRKETIYSTNNDFNKRITVMVGDITQLQVDCIVNAANKRLKRGGGVDGAIHTAAGHHLQHYLDSHYQGCQPGHFRPTPGFNLKAKEILHAVGPKGEQKEVLQSCYWRCLEYMKFTKQTSIAFPCISTGSYGYHNTKACPVVLEIVRMWLELNPDWNGTIIFCVFNEKDLTIYKENLMFYFPTDPSCNYTNERERQQQLLSQNATLMSEMMTINQQLQQLNQTNNYNECLQQVNHLGRINNQLETNYKLLKQLKESIAFKMKFQQSYVNDSNRLRARLEELRQSNLSRGDNYPPLK